VTNTKYLSDSISYQFFFSSPQQQTKHEFLINQRRSEKNLIF